MTGRAAIQAENPRELLADSLQLPKDIITGASIVTVTGTHEVFIENYKGILEYTATRILLQAKNCQIAICGCRLSIDYYTNEDMQISGDIVGISYQ